MAATKKLDGPSEIAFHTAQDFDLDSVVVIIPALNEQRSLPLVLGDLPQVGQVIVVDNGSTDRTAEEALRGGATVVSEPQRGYGAACLRGLEALREANQRGRG